MVADTETKKCCMCKQDKCLSSYRNRGGSQKHLLKGSSIISMLEHYRYSGYIHNFSDNYPLCKEFDFDRKNWIVGTEVYSNYDIEWVITAGSKASFNYFWTVFQRKLIIDKIAGVYLSNN